MNRRIVIGAGITLLGAVLYILGAQILPEVIGLQVRLDGSLGTRVNKYVGLLLPLGVSLYAGLTFGVSGKRSQLLFALLGGAIYLLLFWINLR